MTVDIFEHDDRVVDDEADRDRSAIRDRLSRLYPSTYITAKVPTSAYGTATLGIIVAHRLRKKIKMTITTRAMVSINVN